MDIDVCRLICSSGMSGVPLPFCLRRRIGLSCGMILPSCFGCYCPMRLCASKVRTVLPGPTRSRSGTAENSLEVEFECV